jgi:hypothetical protein
MNKRKIFTCLGLAAAFTAFVVVRKRNKAEGKIRRAVFVFRNELPLKLEFIQDDLSRLQVLKKVRVQDKDGLRNVLALKYEWIKKFAFDICCYFKVDFNLFMLQFQTSKTLETLETIPSRDILLVPHLPPKFTLEAYHKSLLHYQSILESFIETKDYSSFLQSETHLFSSLEQEFDLTIGILKSSHLKYHKNPKISSTLSTLSSLQSSVLALLNSSILSIDL